MDHEPTNEAELADDAAEGAADALPSEGEDASDAENA